MEAPFGHGVELLALVDAPERVRALLPEDAVSPIRIVDGRRLRQRLPGHRELEQFDCPGLQRPILCLPIDGPRPAAIEAVKWLVREVPGSILASSSHGGRPPPLWSLEVIHWPKAPAVDLRRTRWHDHNGLWWTDKSGPMRLPVEIPGRDGHNRAADILRALQDPRHVNTVTRWLDRVAGGHAAPHASDWDVVLCAHYLTVALAHLTVT